jgi:tetratricopeptide (TPR) repeat protein
MNVKALPSPSPTDFSGSIGTFSINADVSPLTVPSGESLTLKITLHGTTRPGSVGDLVLPPIDNCEIFKPERQVFIDTTDNGISTRQTYKYLIIPRQEGTLTVPPISYSYFSPESGTYRNAASQAISIQVTHGKEGDKPQTRYLTQEEIREVGSDIRYIKTDVNLKNQSRYPHRNPVFIFLIPLPFIMLIFSFLYRLQASRKDLNTILNIRKKALSSALRRLTLLKKKGSSLSATEYCGTISDIIEQFISQKFGFAATGRTLDELKVELQKYTSDTGTVTDLASFMSMLDGYRFGGVSFDNVSRKSVIEKTETFLFNMEKSAKKGAMSSVNKLTMLLPVVLTLMSTIHAAPITMWFQKANDFYVEQRYDSAIVYYEKIVESGTQSGAVYYNLGNSWYRLKKPGLARLYFEKALLLDPLDKDISSNIQFINANIVDRVPEPETGFSGMFFRQLHHHFSLNVQLWIFISLLFLIATCISGILYVNRNFRLWLIYLSVLFSILTTTLGVSIGIKIYESEKVSHAILLSAVADAKNEPDGNKILFTAHEGTKFRVRKESGKWSLVSLPNGVSGWIKNSDLGKI